MQIPHVNISYIITGIAIMIGIIIIVLLLPGSKAERQVAKKTLYKFVLNTTIGAIYFFDPFDNFLVYAGANSGKTKSVGKPLLGEYIRHGFAGFIYDYKDFDLTQTAYNLIKKYDYPYKYYYISFTDMDKTYRTNPISPKVVTDENLFLQLIEDFLTAYVGEGKKDEWFNGALGILKGVAITFYYDHPRICTIAHVANYVCSAGREKISNLLESTTYGRTLASAFIDAKGSERTQSSFLSTLTNYLSALAFNKKICYVLSGNDFDFNLIDPANPKLLSVANSFKEESVISPVISLMISLSARQFSLVNKIPFVYFLDEGTTLKISEFEKMPSVLREYKCSFTLITQSGAKVEKRYSKLDRSSIEANFGNQFFGKTKDVEALKNYPLVFGKEEKRKISNTRGNSSGGDSRSKTISTQREERYDSNFFTNLQPGEFVGSTAHSNYKDFHLRFKMYENVEESLPVVRAVLPSEIKNNYNRILSEVNAIN